MVEQRVYSWTYEDNGDDCEDHDCFRLFARGDSFVAANARFKHVGLLLFEVEEVFELEGEGLVSEQTRGTAGIPCRMPDLPATACALLASNASSFDPRTSCYYAYI